MMINHNEVFEEIFINIISNQTDIACNRFKEIYSLHPDQIMFFNGYLISIILKEDQTFIYNFLKEEINNKAIGSYVSELFHYYKNNIISIASKLDILITFGQALAGDGKHAEADIFFRTVQLSRPNEIAIVQHKAENALRKGEFSRSGSLFIKASNLWNLQYKKK
jgi:hypothetical protein